jgi:drug/metabolite transporter (DMT)-like permease
MVGVVFVVRPPFLFGFGAPASTYDHGAVVAGSAALASAVFAAIAMLFLRRVSPGESAEAIALHFSLTAFVAHAALASFLWQGFDGRSLPAMLGAGVCAGGAQVAMTRAYGLDRAARVSGIGYLQVVLAAALGTLVLHEPLPPAGVVGVLLVLGGGVLLTATGAAEAGEPARMSDTGPISPRVDA